MSRRGGPKTKEGQILLIDIGKNVSLQDQDGWSFVQKSRKCASKIIQRKIFSDSPDELSVILIGSEKTQNELEHPNIEVKNQWLTMPNWTMLQMIENLSTTSVDTADWMDGLIVAINLLKSESECKNCSTLKIVMMSNFATSIKSENRASDIIDLLKELQISLVVIGPEPEEDDRCNGVIKVEKSDIQIQQEAIIARIVNEADGVMCGFEEAMALLDHFQKVVAKPSAWNCDLEIGKNITIPISGYKKFAPKNLLKWKKRSIEKNEVVVERVYFEGDKQLEPSDVIKSYLFGQTVIPISGDDKLSMALTTTKCFQLIGFTKKENVPRHMFLGDSAHYIVPRSNVQAANIAITTLVKALMELDMVGIVRKVYCKNCAPRIGALFPTCEDGSYFFYFVTLPFAEDERVIKLPSLKNVKASEEQVAAVDKLIDDMDLSNFDEEEDPYSELVDPMVEHVNNTIVFRALNPNCKLPDEPADAVKNLLQPKVDILEHASDALHVIKNIFCLEEIEQKSYRKGAADVFDRPQTDVNGTNVTDVNGTSVVDIKPDVAQAVASFVQSKVTEVGTVDPEGNFLKLLELGEPFGDCCQQMQSAIKKLFFISSNAIGIKKPLSALSLLREQCVIKDPASYNTFISSLKDDFIDRGHEFFDSIVEGNLGLITSEESKDSTVTPAEAERFYQIIKAEPEIKTEHFEMEAEELLDMI